MSATANFAATPRSEIGTISAANTNRDGTGTIVSVFTTGASGSRIDGIRIKATGNTTLGMVRAFKKIGAGSWELWREYAVSSATPSATVKTFEAVDEDVGEVLKTGVEVGFATHNAESFKVHVNGGDF